MAKKQINTEHIEGRIYEFDLEVKQVKNKDSKNFGMDFITGTLDVAVDEDGLNVVRYIILMYHQQQQKEMQIVHLIH